jgi:O-antigen/teichoic acid export membrane protein
MFIGLALIAPKIVPLAFGARWLSAVPLVQLQCGLGLTTCIGTLQFGVITSQGKANWWFYYQLLQTIMTALVIIIFARFGLAVMVLAIVLKTYAFWFIPIKNSLDLLSMRAKDYLLNFRTPATGSLLMGLSVSAANFLLKSFPNSETVLLDILIGMLTYCLTVIVLDASRIQALVTMITPKFNKFIKTA